MPVYLITRPIQDLRELAVRGQPTSLRKTPCPRALHRIPAESPFSFTIDRRINPEEDLEKEKSRLCDALEGFEIEILQEEPAAATPENDPLAVALSCHVKTITGKEPVFEMCPGLLETRFYASLGIPAFAYGPGLLTVSHGPQEFVPVHNLTQCALIYALTAADVLQ